MLYLALLLPWRYGVEGYVYAVATPARAAMALIDDEVGVAVQDGKLRHSRPFPRLRVSARDDKVQNPIFTRWLATLAPQLLPAIYHWKGTRPYFLAEYRDVFRMTLELPLFLALLLALPRIPWRRRLRPLLLGLGVLYLIHVGLVLAAGLWFHARVGNMAVQGRAIVDTIPDFWNELVNTYQYTGPVVALILFLALLFLGAFGRPSDAEPEPEPEPGAGNGGIPA